MQLVEKHTVTKCNSGFTYLQMITHDAKNLYNSGLYRVRKHFFQTKKYLSFPKLTNMLVRENQQDYRAMPTKVAKQTLRAIHADYTSFFELVELKNKGEYDKDVRPPKYKKKDGYAVVTFPKEAISKHVVYDKQRGLYAHTVCVTDDVYRYTFYSQHKSIDCIRVIPKYHGMYFVVEIVYTQQPPAIVKDNGRYASIDFGINNLMAVFFNFDTDALLFNGRHIKSINQYYNKQRAQMQQELTLCHNTVSFEKNGELCEKVKRTSNRMDRYSVKRTNKINNELHAISRVFVNHVVSLDVSKVIIGYNKGWKQDIKIGKRNNQKFVSIPHARLLALLQYKLALVGIEVIVTEESYTSKCSALDRESIEYHDIYCGARTKRGLFVTRNKLCVNADINGAINIMRKVIPNKYVYFDGIEGVAVRPRLCKVSQYVAPGSCTSTSKVA
jgi:putative transposase